MEQAREELETQSEETEVSQEVLNETLLSIETLYKQADNAHREVRSGSSTFPWDDRERLFLGRYKHPEEKTKSILSTGELTTLNIDRACRVMAQLPSGRFYNMSGKPGANMAMNLIFEHYVLPNATQGGTMLTKLRTIDMYSGVFGTIPAFIEWVHSDKYVGPDLRMIHPRRARPQAGKNSKEEMEIFFIDVEVSKEWLEKREGKAPWMNIDKVLALYGDGVDDQGTGEDDTERSPEQRGKTKTGITLRHSFFSNGDWCIDHPLSRNIILFEQDWYCGMPIAVKHQYPRLDSFWSYSDFERGELTQKSIDTLVRLYLDGVDNSINPPKVMDPESVILSSLKTKDWYVKDGKLQDIRHENVSPQGLQTFQSTYQILKANLLSLGATTDTSVSANVDPGFGKTPEAIKQQGARQGARDAWDTHMMKDFIEDAFTQMANLIAKKGVDKIAFKLLGSSIQKIKEQYPKEDFSILGPDWENGNIEISPDLFKSQNDEEEEYTTDEFRYVMDDGSTLLKQEDTSTKLLEFAKVYFQYPQIQADLQMRNQRFDIGELFKRAVIDSGVQDAEKIIVTEQAPESLAGIGSDGATVMPGEDMLPPEMMSQIPMQEVPQELTQ